MAVRYLVILAMYGVICSARIPSGLVSEEELLQICETYPDLYGCENIDHLMEKRKSAYMRFGRSADYSTQPEDSIGEMEKRKSAYMRFGKRSLSALDDAAELYDQMEKRKSAYMRFGKRKSAYMRFGKRSPSEMEKRKSAYMRFGKRSDPSLSPEKVIESQRGVYSN